MNYEQSIEDERKVSVIVPVYNSDKYLEVCIKSILGQNYKNIELILVNDGSKDQSKEICETYSEKYNNVKLINQENSGASSARNKGILAATGEFIVFVDADDWIDNNHISKLVEAHRENNQLILCGYKELYSDKIVVKTLTNDKYDVADYYKLIDRWGLDPIIGSPCNKLIERELLIDKKLRFPTGRLYAEDFSFAIELFNNVKSIRTIDSNTYNYNKETVNSLSKTNFLDTVKWWEEQKNVYNQMLQCEFLESNCNVINRIMGYFIGSNFVFQIREGHIRKDFIDEIVTRYKGIITNTKKINTTRKMNLVYKMERIYFLNKDNTIGKIVLWILSKVCTL